MNKLILSFLLAVSTLTASAQKVYFIYLQTESEQPFYIRMNDKVQSSSASGYLILPKLLDSTYNIILGFPQNKWAEQNFTITMNRKDHGYLVKNFAEKGWGLFDLQTLEVQMSAKGNAKLGQQGDGGTKNVSAFTEILSKAANDPSLKERTIEPMAEEKKTEVAVQQEVKKTEPVTEKPFAVAEEATMVKKEQPVAAKKEEPEATKPVLTAEPVMEVKPGTAVTTPAIVAEPAIEKKEELKTEIKEEPAVITEEVKTVTTEEYKPSSVKKRSESSTTEGFGLVFIDSYVSGENDTIRLLIPNPKPIAQVAPTESPREEKKMLDIPVEIGKVEEKAPDTKTVVAEPQTTAAQVVLKTDSKTKCVDIATQDDFFKLRKVMAAAESEDLMISEAKKAFTVKCYVTFQVKNLGALFLTDEGKYKFFDTAYPHVSDPESFSILQAELKDEYYVNRFRAMLRN